MQRNERRLDCYSTGRLSLRVYGWAFDGPLQDGCSHRIARFLQRCNRPHTLDFLFFRKFLFLDIFHVLAYTQTIARFFHQ